METRQFLLENDTARAEMSRRGRLLVSSKHTYAARVPSIISTMVGVLALRQGAAALATTPTMAVGAESEADIATVPIDGNPDNVAGLNETRTPERSLRSVVGAVSRIVEPTIPTTTARRNIAAAAAGALVSELSQNKHNRSANSTAGHTIATAAVSEVSRSVESIANWTVDRTTAADVSKRSRTGEVAVDTTTVFRNTTIVAAATAAAATVFEAPRGGAYRNTDAAAVSKSPRNGAWAILTAAAHRNTAVAVATLSSNTGAPTTAETYRDTTLAESEDKPGIDAAESSALYELSRSDGSTLPTVNRTTEETVVPDLSRKGESTNSMASRDAKAATVPELSTSRESAMNSMTTGPNIAAVVAELSRIGATLTAAADRKTAAVADGDTLETVESHPIAALCDTDIHPDGGIDLLTTPIPLIGHRPPQEATVASAKNSNSASERGNSPTTPVSETLSAGGTSRPSPAYLPSIPSSNGHQHHPHHLQTAPIALRPNAPMVLVVYRSDSPPPESLRWDIESAVDDVAGGARLGFLGVGEAFLDVSVATRDGVERARWRALEQRLSLLLASVSAGEIPTGATGASQPASQPYLLEIWSREFGVKRSTRSQPTHPVNLTSDMLAPGVILGFFLGVGYNRC